MKLSKELLLKMVIFVYSTGDAAIRHMLQNKDSDPYRFVHYIQVMYLAWKIFGRLNMLDIESVIHCICCHLDPLSK